jgi:hypothetical protein
MPIQHPHTIKAGTKSKLLLLYAEDGSGQGKTGLRHDAEGATAAFVREGEARATRVDLSAGTPGVYTEGGIAAIDEALLPGVYQLGAPDALLAEGSTRAMLIVRFPGARIRPVEIDLVAYDPQDAERIGVWSLASSKRHEFLRRALPRFTEMELSLGEKLETELQTKLAAEATARGEGQS